MPPRGENSQSLQLHFQAAISTFQSPSGSADMLLHRTNGNSPSRPLVAPRSTIVLKSRVTTSFDMVDSSEPVVDNEKPWPIKWRRTGNLGTAATTVAFVVNWLVLIWTTATSGIGLSVATVFTSTLYDKIQTVTAKTFLIQFTGSGDRTQQTITWVELQPHRQRR